MYASSSTDEGDQDDGHESPDLLDPAPPFDDSARVAVAARAASTPQSSAAGAALLAPPRLGQQQRAAEAPAAKASPRLVPQQQTAEVTASASPGPQQRPLTAAEGGGLGPATASEGMGANGSHGGLLSCKTSPILSSSPAAGVTGGKEGLSSPFYTVTFVECAEGVLTLRRNDPGPVVVKSFQGTTQSSSAPLSEFERKGGRLGDCLHKVGALSCTKRCTKTVRQWIKEAKLPLIITFRRVGPAERLKLEEQRRRASSSQAGRAKTPKTPTRARPSQSASALVPPRRPMHATKKAFLPPSQESSQASRRVGAGEEPGHRTKKVDLQPSLKSPHASLKVGGGERRDHRQNEDNGSGCRKAHSQAQQASCGQGAWAVDSQDQRGPVPDPGGIPPNVVQTSAAASPPTVAQACVAAAGVTGGGASLQSVACPAVATPQPVPARSPAVARSSASAPALPRSSPAEAASYIKSLWAVKMEHRPPTALAIFQAFKIKDVQTILKFEHGEDWRPPAGDRKDTLAEQLSELCANKASALYSLLFSQALEGQHPPEAAAQPIQAAAQPTLQVEEFMVEGSYASGVEDSSSEESEDNAHQDCWGQCLSLSPTHQAGH